MSAPAKPLREAHPEFAGFVDELRRVFGRAAIDEQIRRGMAGEPVFHVKTLPGIEPALELGTPKSAPAMVLDGDQYRAWGEKIRAHQALHEER